MRGLYITLTRRYLWGRKGRSLITILGIGLGVTMVVAVALTNQAIIDSYANMLAGAAGRADLQITSEAGNGFPEQLLAQAAAFPGVRAAVPVVSSGAPVMAHDRKGSATFYGVDLAADRLVREYRLSAGRMPEGEGRETAVSSDLAGGLGLKPGEPIKLLSTTGLREYTVTGIFDSRGTVRGSLGPFAILPLKQAQAAFGREGRLDLIDLLLSPDARAGDLPQRLEAALGSGVRVASPMERTEGMRRLLDSVSFILSLAGSISLFAGGFIIFTNVSMGVAERRRELSILRALGMRRREVLAQVLGEAALQGLLGSLLGLAWGYGLASTMAAQMTAQFLVVYQLQVATVALTPAAIATGLAVGLGTSLAAAFGPARQTVQVSPVEAMRPEAEASGESSRFIGRLGLAGLGTVAAGAGLIYLTWPTEGMMPSAVMRLWGVLLALMLLGLALTLPALLRVLNRYLLRPLLSRLFSTMGRLSADNLVRHPSRTSATMAALMVSITFMVAMGAVTASQQAAFAHWYQQTIGWDLNVSSSFAGLAAQVEMDPSFLEELGRVEGVRLVSPQKMHGITLSDGDPAYLTAFDHRLLRQYSEIPLEEGEWESVIDQMEQGSGAIISPAVARRLGLAPGDTIRLATPAGERPFVVRGIMMDVTPWGGTVQIDRKDYLAYWQDPTASNIALLVEEGVDPATVKRRILERWGESRNLTVRQSEEFWAELKAQYDGVYRLLDGLIWIAVMVSALAIVNTLVAAILERKREIGMLRAIGGRRTEVIRMVTGEALGIGIVGAGMGLLAGFPVAAVMVSSMEMINGHAVLWTVDWGAVGAALAVALVLAPLAGLLPARWASRLAVVEALRYE